MKVKEDLVVRSKGKYVEILNIPAGLSAEEYCKIGFINYIDLSDMEKNWRLDTTWANHSESPNCTVAKLKLPAEML